MKPATRNIVIFALIVLTCGFVGIAVDQVLVPPSRMEGLGVLIWLIGPLVASLLLRAFGGDGWRDFGLGLGQSPYWPAYLAAVLIPFATTLLVLGPALGFGAVMAACLPVEPKRFWPSLASPSPGRRSRTSSRSSPGAVISRRGSTRFRCGRSSAGP